LIEISIRICIHFVSLYMSSIGVFRITYVSIVPDRYAIRQRTKKDQIFDYESNNIISYYFTF